MLACRRTAAPDVPVLCEAAGSTQLSHLWHHWQLRGWQEVTLAVHELQQLEKGMPRVDVQGRT